MSKRLPSDILMLGYKPELLILLDNLVFDCTFTYHFKKILADLVCLMCYTHITYLKMFSCILLGQCVAGWLDALFTAFPSKIRFINFLTDFAVVFVVI